MPGKLSGERLCTLNPPVRAADLLSLTMFGLLSGPLAVSAAQSPAVAHSASAAGQRRASRLRPDLGADRL
jgi:hypothetical protein